MSLKTLSAAVQALQSGRPEEIEGGLEYLRASMSGLPEQRPHATVVLYADDRGRPRPIAASVVRL